MKTEKFWTKLHANASCSYVIRCFKIDDHFSIWNYILVTSWLILLVPTLRCWKATNRSPPPTFCKLVLKFKLIVNATLVHNSTRRTVDGIFVRGTSLELWVRYCWNMLKTLTRVRTLKIQILDCHAGVNDENDDRITNSISQVSRSTLIKVNFLGPCRQPPPPSPQRGLRMIQSNCTNCIKGFIICTVTYLWR